MHTNIMIGFGRDRQRTLIKKTMFKPISILILTGGIVKTFHTGLKFRDHQIDGFRNNFRWDDGISDNGGYRGWLPGTEWFHNPDFHPEGASLLGTSVVDNSAGNTGAFNFLPFSFDALEAYLGDQFTRTVVPVLSGTYTLNEEIFSSYVQAGFEWQDIRGNFGVRYVKTDLDSLTYDDILGQEGGDDIANTRDSSSSELLPSLNIAWDLADDLVLRFAGAKTMSRVSYADFKPSRILRATYQYKLT